MQDISRLSRNLQNVDLSAWEEDYGIVADTKFRLGPTIIGSSIQVIKETNRLCQKSSGLDLFWRNITYILSATQL